MKHLPVYTNSSLNCFRRCPREYYFRYIKLRRPNQISNALVFGSEFHKALNAWWMPEREIKEKYILRDEELVKATELMIGYHKRWINEKFKTIAVEQRFEVDCGSYKLAGSIDAIAEENGKCVIIEHKTSTSDITPGSSYWDKVTSIDSQLSTYWIAAKALGYDVREVVYDVIHRPKSGPYQATPVAQRKYTKTGKLYAGQRDSAETLEEYRLRLRTDIQVNPEWYFCRQRVVRLEDDEWVQNNDNGITHEMIKICELLGYPRNTGSCYQFGNKCNYFDVCNGTDSIDSNNFRTAKTQHEELVNV